MRFLPADENALEEAARVLRDGEIVAYPTETVYGLGVDPFNALALERLYRCKGRPEGNPVLLIVPGVEQLAPLVAGIPPAARVCMEKFWPGALSLLFPASPRIPQTLTAGSGLVCVRCPGDAFARALCGAFGAAITSTSANRSGEPPAFSAVDAALPGVSLVLDGGTLGKQPPSTVFNPTTGEVLREGAISPGMLSEALGKL